jgi:hypothetical protein
MNRAETRPIQPEPARGWSLEWVCFDWALNARNPANPATEYNLGRELHAIAPIPARDMGGHAAFSE